MWSEICELVPLTTGLDSCIEHDIAEYQSCAEANRINGNEYLANELASNIHSFWTSGTVSTNGIGNLEGSSGSGSIS